MASEHVLPHLAAPLYKGAQGVIAMEQTAGKVMVQVDPAVASVIEGCVSGKVSLVLEPL